MSRYWLRLWIAGLAAALMVVGASPAWAGVVGGGGKPGPRVFLESGLPQTFEAGVLCDFEVTISEVENMEYSRTFPNGNTLVTGRLVLRVTNDDTGQSAVRNVSGPGVFGPETAALTGDSLVWLFEGVDGTGELGKGVFVTNGPVLFDGPLLVQAPKSVENLCETLA